jgi:D-glycero-D-manno-heptose 1,7-bisphosphate phosphatase
MSVSRLVDPGCWCDVRRTFDGAAALFLDRDGVVVEDTHFLGRAEDVRMIAGAAATIAAMNRAGVPVVMVTNQSGIGRGFYDWDAFAAVQAAISDALAREGGALDAVFACAYHADAQTPLRVADHPWRKPRAGMILEAGRSMRLDLARSWIVGDKADDIAAGREAGLAGGVVVATGHGADQQARALSLGNAGFAVEATASLPAARAMLLDVFVH